MLDWIRTIWDYNYWAQRKLWDCVLTISESDFKKHVAYSIGSVHIQVVHVMWAEEVWYSHIQKLPRPTFTADDYPTLPAIREKWDEIETKWRSYLQNLREDDLNCTIEVTRFNGERYVHSIQEILLHVVNHGTDHRAQILQLIHGYGGETFEQGMMFYFREQKLV